MSRHAYLLLIHENTFVLKRLIQLLDYEYNDIFIHVDKNSKFIDTEEIRSWVKKSKVVIIKKYKVFWGTNSISLAEIELLKSAVKMNKYSYYHFLSGADLPIKTQQEIHEFFDANQGKEFIHFGTKQYQQDIACRYVSFHFFSKQLGRNRDKFWCDLETYSLAIQRRLNIDRTRNVSFQFYGGANWCSITEQFAEYVVCNWKKYRKSFRLTQISDELIWQTMIMDSPYKDNLYMPRFEDDYKACMRYIDWKRGTPYVFRSEDLDEILHAEEMFARKFDEKIDKRVVEELYQKLFEVTEKNGV